MRTSVDAQLIIVYTTVKGSSHKLAKKIEYLGKAEYPRIVELCATEY